MTRIDCLVCLFPRRTNHKATTYRNQKKIRDLQTKPCDTLRNFSIWTQRKFENVSWERERERERTNHARRAWFCLWWCWPRRREQTLWTLWEAEPPSCSSVLDPRIASRSLRCYSLFSLSSPPPLTLTVSLSLSLWFLSLNSCFAFSL